MLDICGVPVWFVFVSSRLMTASVRCHDRLLRCLRAFVRGLSTTSARSLIRRLQHGFPLRGSVDSIGCVLPSSVSLCVHRHSLGDRSIPPLSSSRDTRGSRECCLDDVILSIQTGEGRARTETSGLRAPWSCQETALASACCSMLWRTAAGRREYRLFFFIATFILSLTAYLLFAVDALCTLARCETESGPWVSRCPW